MPEWFDETFRDRVRFGLRIERRVHSERTPYQRIDVFDTEQFGRVLALDGILQTSEADEHFYHEMLVQPAMVTASSIRRVLVVGGGDGGTVREVLRHPEVERVVMVEIDPRVVEICREHLPTIGTAWDDPRLDLRIGDGVAFVRDCPEDSFDLVILDGSDPVGPSEGLVGSDFYLGVRRCLRRDGTFALQSEPPMYYRAVFLAIQTALRDSFDVVAPYFGPVPLYASGNMSWTLAGDGIDPTGILADRVAILGGACRYYSEEIHRGAFAASLGSRGASRGSLPGER